MNTSSQPAYLENFVESTYFMPTELSRILNAIRALDERSAEVSESLATATNQLLAMPPAHKQQQTIGLIPPEYETLLKRIEHDQKVLTQFGDEKLHIAQQVYDLIEMHAMELERTIDNFIADTGIYDSHAMQNQWPVLGEMGFNPDFNTDLTNPAAGLQGFDMTGGAGAPGAPVPGAGLGAAGAGRIGHAGDNWALGAPMDPSLQMQGLPQVGLPLPTPSPAPATGAGLKRNTSVVGIGGQKGAAAGGSQKRPRPEDQSPLPQAPPGMGVAPPPQPPAPMGMPGMQLTPAPPVPPQPPAPLQAAMGGVIAPPPPSTTGGLPGIASPGSHKRRTGQPPMQGGIPGAAMGAAPGILPTAGGALFKNPAPPGLPAESKKPTFPANILQESDISLALVGRHAELYWPDNDTWYLIEIQSLDLITRNANIMYWSGEAEDLNLSDIARERHMALIPLATPQF